LGLIQRHGIHEQGIAAGHHRLAIGLRKGHIHHAWRSLQRFGLQRRAALRWDLPKGRNERCRRLALLLRGLDLGEEIVNGAG
jgi:hypothetical protein